MGIVGYYRKFVERFSAIAYPITSLQRKGVKFEWTKKFQNSFEQLKLKLTTAPILKIADPDKGFVVRTDACREGLGGVLLQENSVIAYESRKLKTHEHNYSAYDLELAAVIHALKMWRHYLLGKKFTLMTDHIRVKYLFSQIDLNARQARWLFFMSEFDMDIKHIRGKENKIADALSRNSCQNINNIGSSANFDLEYSVKKVANQDPNYETLQVKIIKKEMAKYTQNKK